MLNEESLNTTESPGIKGLLSYDCLESRIQLNQGFAVLCGLALEAAERFLSSVMMSAHSFMNPKASPCGGARGGVRRRRHGITEQNREKQRKRKEKGNNKMKKKSC